MKNVFPKVIGFLFLIVLAVAACFLIKDGIKKSQTVSDMALDTTNTVITGIWDSEHLSKYKYLVIPDIIVGSGNMLEFSKVTTIGEGAFEGNAWLKTVHIPVHIKKIQKNAFSGCNGLEKITYAGTEEDWRKMVIESGNEILRSLPIEFNAKAPNAGDR